MPFGIQKFLLDKAIEAARTETGNLIASNAVPPLMAAEVLEEVTMKLEELKTGVNWTKGESIASVGPDEKRKGYYQVLNHKARE